MAQDTTLQIRLTTDQKNEFIEVCKLNGTVPSDMLREAIRLYVLENRK